MKSKQGTKKSFFLGEDAREISKEVNIKWIYKAEEYDNI